MRGIYWTKAAKNWLMAAICMGQSYYRRYCLLKSLNIIYAHSRRPETRAEAAPLIRKLEGRG